MQFNRQKNFLFYPQPLSFLNMKKIFFTLNRLRFLQAAFSKFDVPIFPCTKFAVVNKRCKAVRINVVDSVKKWRLAWIEFSKKLAEKNCCFHISSS
jgi:hypothetical protein